MIYKRSSLLIVFLLSSVVSISQTITQLQAGKNTSIRGLSVVDNRVAWVSGSNGWVAGTTDQGKTWNWKQLSGYEKMDFRDIEAFSANEAILISAGSPAVILLTLNGGKNWQEMYQNNAAEIFLDGMDFWNRQNGLIFGDPINGKMQLLKTINGGKSWQDISSKVNLELDSGEASFAASGTTIRTQSGGKLWIATGGLRSRLFASDDYGQTWKTYPIPITQGKNSTGPFSIAFYDSQTGIAVGGDYLTDTLTLNNLLLTSNGGKSWHKPLKTTAGFRSAVEYVSKNKLVATGTSGTDVSFDGGQTWRTVSKEGFHAVRKAKSGSWVLMAGSEGRVSTIRF